MTAARGERTDDAVRQVEDDALSGGRRYREGAPQAVRALVVRDIDAAHGRGERGRKAHVHRVLQGVRYSHGDVLHARGSARESGERVDEMSDYIVTCDEETASWIGNDADSMRLLVRCRDCRRYHPKDGEMLSCRFEYNGFVQWRSAEPDGFCKWACRKSKED